MRVIGAFGHFGHLVEGFCSSKQQKILSIASDFAAFSDARTITTKFVRHQAFQSEIQSNKERLEALQSAAQRLTQEKPEFAQIIEPQVSAREGVCCQFHCLYG